MAAAKILSLELSKAPPVHLYYDMDRPCKTCANSIAIVNETEHVCVMCLMAKVGKDTITVFGWHISKSGIGQVHASRIQA